MGLQCAYGRARSHPYQSDHDLDYLKKHHLHHTERHDEPQQQVL
jgi:hypothetical protein